MHSLMIASPRSASPLPVMSAPRSVQSRTRCLRRGERSLSTLCRQKLNDLNPCNPEMIEPPTVDNLLTFSSLVACRADCKTEGSAIAYKLSLQVAR